MNSKRRRLRLAGCAVSVALALGCSNEKTRIHSPPLVKEEAATTYMKWEPGHYFLSKLDPAQVFQGSEASPFLQGLQRQYYWSDLEPARNQYVFDSIDKDLAALKHFKKKLSIMVVYKYRASPSQSSLPRYVLALPPAQVGTLSVAPFYAQGTANDGPYNQGDHANFGHPETRKAFGALLHALALRYDNDPSVSFLQFSETSISADVSRDLQGNFIDGVMEMNRNARTEFVHTPLIQSINFPRGRLADLVANFASLKMGFGGPDVFFDSLSSPSNALGFDSKTSPGVYHYNMTNNGNLPIAMQVHHENLLYATRDLQLARTEHHLPPDVAVQNVYRFAVEKLKSNYIVWQVFGPNDPYRRAVEANLKAGMPVLTQCPLVYQGSCRSSGE